MRKNDLIIACDFKDGKTAYGFLELFPKQEKPFIKIGMELFFREGPDFVKKLSDAGYDIFLDMKLHDIPNTVKGAMRNIAKLNVKIVNLHAAGTVAMMKAALEGLSEETKERPLLIAVTQLTSTGETEMRNELLITSSLEETVVHYANNAKKAGLDGVVCSPVETPAVKQACGGDFITVTPGIRYPDSKADDQVRVTTPKKARESGCDYIVVGRPITASADPVKAYLQMKTEFLGG